jgi:putative membrane protein insertion efficiency factor
VFARVMVRAIRFYQRAVSPLTGPSCRFTPSCSEYAAVAIDRYGPLSGGWLALRRILRCHPFGGQGFDPVPDLDVREVMVADPGFQNGRRRGQGSRGDLT